MKATETLDLKINLDFKQLTSIVKQLNSSEKMKLNEAIWDDGMEIPEEHQKLVLQRIKKARQNIAYRKRRQALLEEQQHFLQFQNR